MEKEEKRALNLRDSKELNKFGDRIKWVRSFLGLSQSQVAIELGIPLSSFSGRENGVRSTNVEEFLLMAEYFNPLYQEKIKIAKVQKYNGIVVNKITPQFLTWGLYE